MIPAPTLELMADNFAKRAAQFRHLAERDPSYAKGARTFDRLAADCRKSIEAERSHDDD